MRRGSEHKPKSSLPHRWTDGRMDNSEGKCQHSFIFRLLPPPLLYLLGLKGLGVMSVPSAPSPQAPPPSDSDVTNTAPAPWQPLCRTAPASLYRRPIRNGPHLFPYPPPSPKSPSSSQCKRGVTEWKLLTFCVRVVSECVCVWASVCACACMFLLILMSDFPSLIIFSSMMQSAWECSVTRLRSLQPKIAGNDPAFSHVSPSSTQ